MQYTIPDYYKKFQCMAGECEFTCCAGWQIMIDKKSLKKYNKIKGRIGSRLHNEVDQKASKFRQYDGRCAFLNEENLCDLFLEGGRDLFCKTCKTYPRHVEEFEGLREISLSLSCPAAALLILKQGGYAKFLHYEKDLDKEENFEDFDFFLFTKLMDARELIIAILQKRECKIALRFAVVLAFCHDLQERLDRAAFFEVDELLARYQKPTVFTWFQKKMEQYDRGPDFEDDKIFKKCFVILDELEVLEKDWRQYYKNAEKTLFSKEKEKSTVQKGLFDVELEQLMIYFVYTYFCGAVYCGNAYVKIKYALLNTFLIKLLALSESLTMEVGGCMAKIERAAYRYAREVEHSDKNKSIMEKILDDETSFGLDCFFKMIYSCV